MRWKEGNRTGAENGSLHIVTQTWYLWEEREEEGRLASVRLAGCGCSLGKVFTSPTGSSPQDKCREVPYWAEMPRVYSPVVFRHWFGTSWGDYRGFRGGTVVKNPPTNAGDPEGTGLIPVLERSLWEGNSNPLQYVRPENSMDRGIWQATVHGVEKSQTQLSTHTHLRKIQLQTKHWHGAQRHGRWRLSADCVPYSWMSVVFLKEEPSNTSLWLHLKTTCLSAAAAAKSLQLCPTLCNPIDSSPPGSPVPGILQARTLEWVAISFSNACMRANPFQSCPFVVDKRTDHHLLHWGQELIQKKILKTNFVSGPSGDNSPWVFGSSTWIRHEAQTPAMFWTLFVKICGERVTSSKTSGWHVYCSGW